MYSVYVDRQDGGFFCWFYNCEGEKTSKQVSTKQELVKWIKNHLDGLSYKIIYCT